MSVSQFITGRVTDSESGDGIEGATIEVFDVDVGRVDATAVSDPDGDYTAQVVADTYELTAEARGYDPATTTVTVDAGETATQDFVLDIRAYKMRGELSDDYGIGVHGLNTASTGIPIGVRGSVPNNAEGYGLETPDDAMVAGVIDSVGAFEAAADGDTGLRVYPAQYDFIRSYGGNVIGGYAGNGVTNGGRAATVSGGGREGASSVDGSSRADTNVVTEDFGTVGGGYNNRADNAGVVGGGKLNTASGNSATVAGGWQNRASGDASTVGGGYGNDAQALYGTVAGGGPTDENNLANTKNLAVSRYGTIGGGGNNLVGVEGSSVFDAEFGTIAGGEANTVDSDHGVVGGGESNTAGAAHGTVGGGDTNEVTGNRSVVAGGTGNTVSGTESAIGGGDSNAVSGNDAVIGGGYQNEVSDQFTTVGGGRQNYAGDYAATVAGGNSNAAHGNRDTIGGGRGNVTSTSGTTTSGYATIGGGSFNSATGGESTVGGGDSNDAYGDQSTIAGGFSNETYGDYDSIGGGRSNQTSTSGTTGNVYATVPGGYGNRAEGRYSFAAGYDAGAFHDGTFVWSDDTSGFDSTDARQFLIDANNGVGIRTNQPESQLHVTDSISGNTHDPADHVVTFENTNTSSYADVLALKTNVSTPTSLTHFITFLSDQNTEVGAIDGNSSGGVNYRSSSADIAEYFPKADPKIEVEAGDVVGLCAGEVVADPTAGDRALVVSTAPMLTGNDPGEDDADHVCLAMLGQVPVTAGADVEAGERLVATPDGTAVPTADGDSDALPIGLALNGADPGDSVTALVGCSGTGSANDSAEKDDRIADLETEVETLRIENDALRNRLDAIESQLGPASAPADD